MTINLTRRAAALGALASVLTAAGCGLPRPGPNKKEIFAGSVLNGGDAFIVTVNPRVTRATSVLPSFGFSSDFRNAGLVGCRHCGSVSVAGTPVCPRCHGRRIGWRLPHQLQNERVPVAQYVWRFRATGRA